MQVGNVFRYGTSYYTITQLVPDCGIMDGNVEAKDIQTGEVRSFSPAWVMGQLSLSESRFTVSVTPAEDPPTLEPPAPQPGRTVSYRGKVIASCLTDDDAAAIAAQRLYYYGEHVDVT